MPFDEEQRAWRFESDEEFFSTVHDACDDVVNPGPFVGGGFDFVYGDTILNLTIELAE